MRLVQLDQEMPVVLGIRQQILDPLHKSLSTFRVGPAQQLLGLLPRQSQAMQGGADRLATTGPAEPLAHPADQAPQGPARRRIGSRQQVRPNRSRTQPTKRRKVQRGAGSAPATGGAAATRWAVRTVSPRPASMSEQKGGGRRYAGKRAPRGRACCIDAATSSPSADDGACAWQRAWHNSPG